MKRKEAILGGSAEEYVVPEWRTDVDRLAKRCGIEDMLSSSNTNKCLGDEVCTPWLLQGVTTLEVNES
jgi:hypothetical protein